MTEVTVFWIVTLSMFRRAILPKSPEWSDGFGTTTLYGVTTQQTCEKLKSCIWLSGFCSMTGTRIIFTESWGELSHVGCRLQNITFLFLRGQTVRVIHTGIPS